MAFEFFFGVFGLISSDSSTRHKSRLDNDWRLFTPLSTSLFRDATLGAQHKNSTGNIINTSSSTSNFSKQQQQQQQQTGNNAAENPFSSSNSSIGSSTGSISTINSAASLIKQQQQQQQHQQSTDQITGINTISGQKFDFSGKQQLHSSGIELSGASESTDQAAAATTTTTTTNNDKNKAANNEQAMGATGANSSTASTLNGNLNSNLNSDTKDNESTGVAKRTREIYCRLVSSFLWFNALRLGVGLIADKTLFTLDFYCIGQTKLTFLIPALCLAIQVAASSSIFIRNNDETNWLVPFYSSKDYLIRSRSNFRPRMKDYKKRVNISVALSLFLATISALSLSAYLIQCAYQSDIMKMSSSSSSSEGVSSAAAAAAAAATATGSTNQASNSNLERIILIVLLINDVIWSIYATFICFLVSFYFNLICSIMKARFHYISKIIEDLAESNTRKTTNQARKITTLYLEHNEACELLDESNDFWQYLILFTYFTYIPAYCYCLYNIFFVDFAPWPSFITWVIHNHMAFIILLISFSAAGVSTEAHAPYTSLHTLSLIQLPLDVEVNITTFLHRVRGLTIGYSCYDLFAITNASMSNTAAACASYFLIVADFSRSSVFNNAQANASTSSTGDAATGSTAAPPSIGSSSSTSSSVLSSTTSSTTSTTLAPSSTLSARATS